MKNHVYNPLQKLILVVMLLFAGSAIAQTTSGQKTETKTYDAKLLSPKASNAATVTKKDKVQSTKATSTTAGGNVKSTSTATGTKKVQAKSTTPRVSLGNGAKPVAKTASVKAGSPVKTSEAYTKPAPLSREAQLKVYIADIDAKMLKLKGTPRESSLITQRAAFQKELDEIQVKKANEKKQ